MQRNHLPSGLSDGQFADLDLHRVKGEYERVVKTNVASVVAELQ